MENEDFKRYFMKYRIKRRHFPYVITTWEKFRIPTVFENEIDAITRDNLELKNLMSKVKNKLKNLHFKPFIDKHVDVNDLKEVTKKSLSCLFRAFGTKILPVKLFGCESNSKLVLRNLNILFMAGKGTTIWADDILNGVDFTKISWIKNHQDIEILFKIVVWLSEQLFWRLIKSYFHITEKSCGKCELFYYRKRDFQKLTHKAFANLVREKSLKMVNSKFRQELHKNFSFTPVTAKCRILPKKSLDSFRLICRSEKLNSAEQNDLESDLRILLNHAAKTLFPNMVDVKGKNIFLLHSVENMEIYSHAF